MHYPCVVTSGVPSPSLSLPVSLVPAPIELERKAPCGPIRNLPWRVVADVYRTRVYNQRRTE